MVVKKHNSLVAHGPKSDQGEAHHAYQVAFDGTASGLAAVDVQGAIDELTLEGVPGPQGEPGIQGEPGPQGEPGATGTFDGSTIVMDKTAGNGIKVDTAAPAYPWKDLIGFLTVDESGANAATLAAYRGGAVREYRFSVGDKIDLRFHMPHDYAPGTDLFIHFHWSHNGTAITGTGTIAATFVHSYAKGHQQAAFTAEESVVCQNTNITTANTPQYHHRIEEVQLSATGGAGGLLDTGLLEPDGLLLINFTLDTIPTIAGGTTAEPFVHAIDIHYQSTGIGTAQKAPDFYA